MEWLLAIFGIYCLYLGVKWLGKKNTKEKAIRSLEDELSNLMMNNTSLVATAYRNSVSSNSFGKKGHET